MVKLPEGLQGLANLMVENSADLLRKSEGPMLPTLMASDDPPNAPVITVIEGSTLEEALRLARQATNAISKVTRAYVLAWDGYVTLDSERSDAILMEAYESSLEQPALLAQRYKRRPFQLVGSIVSVDEMR